jgi:hypothetical protein
VSVVCNRSTSIAYGGRVVADVTCVAVNVMCLRCCDCLGYPLNVLSNCSIHSNSVSSDRYALYFRVGFSLIHVPRGLRSLPFAFWNECKNFSHAIHATRLG